MTRFLDTFFNPGVLAESFPDVASGVSITAALALAVLSSGIPLGLALALLRTLRLRPLELLIVSFADVFRALPPLVVLVVLYFAFPFVGIELAGFTAAWLGLGLVLAAFAEEIFWAGILSVERGQWEAARSTGLTHAATLREVVLPQALRLSLAPLTNRALAISKSTALASVIAVPEILNRASSAQAQAANPSPLTLAALLYLALFLPLVALSRVLESRYAWKR
jgi:polar amino acid transport system permease protein